MNEQFKSILFMFLVVSLILIFYYSQNKSELMGNVYDYFEGNDSIKKNKQKVSKVSKCSKDNYLTYSDPERRKIIATNDVRQLMINEVGWDLNKNVEDPWVNSKDPEGEKKDEEVRKAANRFSLCSPACCSRQWKLPFNPGDERENYEGQGYSPTDYNCNNGYQGAGCLCMKDEQIDFIASRGGNT